MFSLEHKQTASKLRSQQLQQQQPPERGPRVGVGKPGVEFQTAPPPPFQLLLWLLWGCGGKDRDKN